MKKNNRAAPAARPLVQFFDVVYQFSLGSLSNHDDDGNENLTNLHIWQWKNSVFARFARAFFIFWHFVDVLVLSTTWNDQFCRCVDDVSIWWQMFNFVFLCPKRWFQFNSRIVRTHFSDIMTLNNWKTIAETRSHIFRWRSRCCRLRVCLSSLFLRFWQRKPLAVNHSFFAFAWKPFVPSKQKCWIIVERLTQGKLL